MASRISTSQVSLYSLEAMLRNQKELSRTQLQISTGRRILAPADDPYGSSRLLNLRETVAINEQYQINAGHAKNRLNLEEGVLEGVSNAIQRIRELAIQANNDSQTRESRNFIAQEIEKLFDQILDLANTTDANGEYLFAGYKGKTRPFAPDINGNVQYYGDDGQRVLKIGTATSVEVSDPGSDVFLAVKNGNGTFTTVEGVGNQGSGIIDPGSVIGTYYPDDYTIKFIPPSNPADPNAPPEYYILNGNGEVIVAGSGVTPPGGVPLYPDEASFLAAVSGGTDSGVPYQEFESIAGLDQYGIQTYIIGTPDASTVPGDSFTISPSSNQSLFTTIRNLIDTLDIAPVDDAASARFHNAMNRVITDLDQNLGKILEVRARVGARLNTVDKQLDINESFNLQMKQSVSEIEDLDYAEAVTRLNLQLTGLQGAQQTYMKIQGLSLFNYLR